MADDLADDWWSEEDVKEVEMKSEGKKDSSKSVKKKGKKRLALPADVEDQPPTKQKAQSSRQKKDNLKDKKKKKKKSSKVFVKRKITEEDTENLNKNGTPADINAFLTSKLKRDKKPQRSSDPGSGDSESDDDTDYTLSVDDDFLPANEGHSAVEYLCDLIPGWQKAVKKAQLPHGSPLILILCSSAIRAVQLNRDIKLFLGKECKTAKLFAKHMKLDEQKKFLEKTVCHAAIGTPNRVQALLEAGVLKLDKLHAVVLDWNWRDVKMKRMLDIPDVKRDLQSLLRKFAVEKIKDTVCRVAIL